MSYNQEIRYIVRKFRNSLIYDNEKCVASISSNDWRWWVEECDMLR